MIMYILLTIGTIFAFLLGYFYAFSTIKKFEVQQKWSTPAITHLLEACRKQEAIDYGKLINDEFERAISESTVKVCQK